MFVGRNVTDKLSNRNTLYYASSNRYGDGAGNTVEENPNPNALVAFSALTLLVGRQEGKGRKEGRVFI